MLGSAPCPAQHAQRQPACSTPPAALAAAARALCLPPRPTPAGRNQGAHESGLVWSGQCSSPCKWNACGVVAAQRNACGVVAAQPQATCLRMAGQNLLYQRAAAAGQPHNKHGPEAAVAVPARALRQHGGGGRKGCVGAIVVAVAPRAAQGVPSSGAAACSRPVVSSGQLLHPTRIRAA